MTDRWIATTPMGESIRLSETTWTQKLLISHPEFTQDPQYEQEIRATLEHPEFIVEGWRGELLNLRWCATAPGGPKHLCVVYREADPVGFIITAFFVSRYGKLVRRKLRWQKQR